MRWQVRCNVATAGQSYIKQRGQARFGQGGNWERRNVDQPYQPPQDAKQILNDIVRALRNSIIPQSDRHQRSYYNDRHAPRETSQKPRSETRSPLRVKEDYRNAKKTYSKDKNSSDKKNIGKGKQKAYLVEEDNESLEDYDPDAYDDEEDHLLDEEPDANFTSTVTPTKSSGPQCRTCLVYFTSNNKLHQLLRKDNCKIMTQIACAVTQNIPTHVPKATQPTSTSTVRKVIDSAVDSSQEIGTGYGFRRWKQRSSSAQSLAVLIPEQVLLWLIKDFFKDKPETGFLSVYWQHQYHPCTKQQ